MFLFPYGQMYHISCSSKHFCFYLELLIKTKQNKKASLFGRHQQRKVLEENKILQVMLGCSDQDCLLDSYSVDSAIL